MAMGLITQIDVDGAGVAWIAGTNTKVKEVVLDKLAYGWSPEEMHFQHPHLSMAQIHAALAYYYENQDRLDEEIRRDLEEVDQMSGQVTAVSTPQGTRLKATSDSNAYFERKTMKCILLAVLLLGTCAQASPQDIAISGMVGVGRANGEAEDIRSRFFPTGGASLNLKIGRPEIKLDYEYVDWDRRVSLHLVSAGWFIQSRPKLLRPFFQLGWAVGLEKYTTQTYWVVDGSTLVVNRDVTQGFQGLAMGGGFTTAFREQFFTRPELRWKLIGPGPMMLIAPVLSFGYRF